MDDFKKAELGTFEEELQRLVDYGHDCCARIDDKIHECCERIKKAHDVEVGSYQIALSWKQEQDQLATTYDVLGNERHKAVCELRKYYRTLCTPDQFVSTLYKAFHGTEGFPANIYVMQKGVRDRLIYLLGGDTAEVEDGMDAAGRGAACGDCAAHGADRRVADSAGDSHAEGVAPVTQELRDYLEAYRPVETDTCMEVARIGTLGYQGIMERLDAIDAVHANLERENAELRKRTMYPAESERVNMLEREVKRLTSECKTQRNNFDQATSAREHWKNLYEQALEHTHDLERDYEVACHVNERQEREYLEWYNKACHMQKEIDALKEHHEWAPESHYMMLPKDSDGVPVRIGDVMEWPDTTTAEVVGVGDGTFFYVEVGEKVAEWARTCDKIHHVQESVEDTLREFARAWTEWQDGAPIMNPVESFAPKFRLADDEEVW